MVRGEFRPGSKAVAAAAYRAGARLEDHHHGETHDYSQRRGVVHAEILSPPDSAPWLTDRSLLWNTVEAMEKRSDAQLAREFNMALPHELGQGERVALVRSFVERHFVARGMVADIALHDPVPEKGDHRHNFHAHVMLTLRRATPDGLDAVKTREWNSKELLNVWRAEWALACNAALERAGKKVRVDHRTLVAQRDWAREIGDRVAAERLHRAPEIHVGPKARKMARRQFEPRSQAREVGAPGQREATRPAERRKRDYPAIDRGSRLTWFERILAGNNEKLKRDLVTINRRFDRFSQKLDHWERRATFYGEGAIGGKGFRFDRWKASQEGKARKAKAEREAAHARMRVARLQGFLKELERVLAGQTQAREKGLVRAREVEGWIRGVRTRERGARLGRGKGPGTEPVKLT